jgi:hypothetical protein
MNKSNFKLWLEERHGFDHYKDLLLKFLNLDGNKDGMSTSIKSLKESGYTKESLKKKILGLGDISDLNQDTIDAMIDIIDNKDFSTVGDIVRVLSHNEIK